MPTLSPKSSIANPTVLGLICIVFVIQGLLFAKSAHARSGHVLSGEGAVIQRMAGVATGRLIGADFRWMDDANTKGFRRVGLDSGSSFTGMDQDSIPPRSLAAEFEMREDLFLRMGYAFNQNSASEKNTTSHILAPVIIQRHGSIGLSWKIADAWHFDMAYRRGSEHSTSSQIASPTIGSVPGAEVEGRMSTQSLLFGFRVEF
jgi:hypothetical protein